MNMVLCAIKFFWQTQKIAEPETEFKNSLVIHEGNTKQISIDVRKNTNEHRILYKRTWDFI